jgi:hypothetical protein
MSTPNPTTLLHELLNKHFPPAPGESDQRKMMSTSDLYAILDEHAPGQFIPGQLFEAMQNLGYARKLVGEQLMWSVCPR